MWFSLKFPALHIYEICHKNECSICQKMRLLLCGKLNFPSTFPQVFPTTFPQVVDNSVDIFVNIWKKPRLSRLFWVFTRVKSVFGIVGKYCLIIIQFSTGRRKFRGKNSQKFHPKPPDLPSPSEGEQGHAIHFPKSSGDGFS